MCRWSAGRSGSGTNWNNVPANICSRNVRVFPSADPAARLVEGVRRAAIEHRLAIEDLNSSELGRRFPLFRFDDSYVGVLERDAGFLYVERCVQSAAADAVAHGATLRWQEPVGEWHASAKGVTVRTDRDMYHAARLVITAGAWATRLLGDLGSRLTVMRQVPIWLAPADPRPFAGSLPDLPGRHAEWHVLRPAGDRPAWTQGRTALRRPELAGPESVNRDITDADETPVRSFVREHLPAADGPRRHAVVCLYTLSPDRHFIIDRHPEHEAVAFAAGFSGHGFKFAPVVGELLADLVETGITTEGAELFRLR